ncbi:ribulose phosphate epimerase [Maribacter sp. 4U21]|uniref:pseudouridine synthase n=1 Tax=Maribacter sp. 4U21 TaxID=1889779 RepID=UPI000C1523CE|nr:pseudouridine synthase [Maribacter sp. 4U21]PIB23731.1 ribulose phosphate epimerase [Maribacter sp. 4U21]
MSESSHFKLYKPFGMLSQLTSSEKRQVRKKKFLGELYDFPPGIMPIGRLDEKSEGLLLMTTDGKLSNHINKANIAKEYYAQLDGVITTAALIQLRKGVIIGLFGKNYTTKPCQVAKLQGLPILPPADSKLRIGVHRPTSWISITLTEGKFRQVRKMTAAVGFPTVRLVRVRIGTIGIGDMNIGDVLPTTLDF